MEFLPIIKGMASYLPNSAIRYLKKGAGDPKFSDYYYGVWIKHLTLLHHNGMESIPVTVAELGPGDSIGAGLCALLSGVQEYYAFDVMKFANAENDLKLFDDLVSYFSARAPIPSKDGHPNIVPFLDENCFPSQILTEEVLEKSLQKDRIEAIRKCIIDNNYENPYVKIKYIVPWNNVYLREETVDLIFSHAVLEHVDDLEATYETMRKWLKPKGYMSHAIDFSSHGLSKKWFGHWKYSDLEWKLVRGRKTYLINRLPHSAHIDLLKENNFRILYDDMLTTEICADRDELLKNKYWFSDDDLRCKSGLIQSVKMAKDKVRT